jgi:hypothetical protein
MVFPRTNWGIEITKRDLVTGKPICKPDGKHEKMKIGMKDGQLPNGQPQPLYFLRDILGLAPVQAWP